MSYNKDKKSEPQQMELFSQESVALKKIEMFCGAGFANSCASKIRKMERLCRQVSFTSSQSSSPIREKSHTRFAPSRPFATDKTERCAHTSIWTMQNLRSIGTIHKSICPYFNNIPTSSDRTSLFFTNGLRT